MMSIDEDAASHFVHASNNNYHHETLVSLVQTKLATGAELTKEDLQGLQASLQDGGNSNDTTTTTTATENYKHAWMPFLNRNFLDRSAAVAAAGIPSSLSYRLVRHFGMVQDMMDPEYYVAEVHGQSMHFRDPPSSSLNHNNNHINHNSLDEAPIDGGDFLAHNLAERQPLLIVPVPYSSEWFVNQTMMRASAPQGNEDTNMMQDSSVVIPESPPSQQQLQQQQQDADGQSCRKRNRDDYSNDSGKGKGRAKAKTTKNGEASTPLRTMDCDDHDAEQQLASTPPSEAEAAPVHGQESDWWPAGSLESPVDECPVLAKLYYDQYPSTSSSSSLSNDSSTTMDDHPNKLRLNDLVETIGIVSMDPWDADFLQHDDHQDIGMMLAPPLPPPSRLPRLHVLSFRRVDLDDVVAAAIQQRQQLQQQQASTSSSSSHEEQPSLTQELPLSSNGSGLGQDPLEAWTNQCSSLHSTALAETLFLTLVAKAERKFNGSTGEIQRGPQHALGCASLQLVCPNDQAADRLYQQLHPFLQQVCPVMAGMDFTSTTTSTTAAAENKNGPPLGITSVPTKESGRIWRNPWQLPSGATLLIRAPHNNAWNLRYPTVRPIVEELCSQHRLPYKFEGGMRVPFDSDYRIIVISSATNGSHNDDLLVPCTLRMKLNQDLVGGITGTNSHEATTSTTLFPTEEQTLEELRRALAQGRRSRTGATAASTSAITTTPNVGLPSLVLEQAQNDFLHRRGHARRSMNASTSSSAAHELSSTTPPTTTTATTTMSALPDETDFHRWLTLTRLYARARSATTATTADWESALGLDDTIRVSYS